MCQKTEKVDWQKEKPRFAGKKKKILTKESLQRTVVILTNEEC